MFPTDRTKFDALVIRYMQIWDRTMSAATLDLWWEALSDQALSAIHHAFEISLKHATYAPRPAGIRRKATGNESEGGTIAGDNLCSHPGCKLLWTLSVGGTNSCPRHSGVEMPNFLQRNAPMVLGAARVISMLGDDRARAAYGDEIVNCIIANLHNDYTASPADWTVTA